MTNYDFDNPVVMTTVKTYNFFSIRKIMIPFEQDAEVEVMLVDTDNVCIFETVIIPLEVYTGWTYSTELVVDYCKTYLQNNAIGLKKNNH
jgi:hypothetical protein